MCRHRRILEGPGYYIGSFSVYIWSLARSPHGRPTTHRYSGNRLQLRFEGTGPGPRLLRSPSGDARESGGICCGTAVSGTIRASVSFDRHAGPGRLRAVRPPGVSAGAGGRWIRSVKLAFRRGVMTAVTGAVRAGRRSTPLSLWHRCPRPAYGRG